MIIKNYQILKYFFVLYLQHLDGGIQWLVKHYVNV